MSTSKVSADLRAVIDMADRLEDRAIDAATRGDRLGSPPLGGEAMVNLAPVASMSDWGRRNELAADALAPYEDPDELWSSFQTLRYWSEDWREQLGMNHDDPTWRPSLRSEASFLRNVDVLNWAWVNEPHFEEFAADVKAARRKLEDVVREGERSQRSRVVCDNPACEKPKALVRVYGKGAQPDSWRCPYCRMKYDESALKRTLAKQMHAKGAERWVPLREAVDALRVQGWQERTVMRWVEPLRHSLDRCVVCRKTWAAREYPVCPRKVIKDGEISECGGDLLPVWKGDREAVVESYCEVATHHTMTWWPSLWHRHLLARAKRDAAEMSKNMVQ